MSERPRDSGDYDATDDLRASIEFAYAFIRQRAANGGRGWHGWPENPDGGAQ
jgi:hypothetical protein